MKEGEGGLFVSGCQQHQQLGSGRGVTGAEGEGVWVCARARARVCARSGGETAGERERGSTCSLSAPLCPLCRRVALLPFSPGLRHLAW